MNWVLETKNKKRWRGLLVKVIVIKLLLLTSCHKEPQLSINKTEPVTAGSKSSDPNVITIEVAFNGTPGSAGSVIAPLKYNKTSVVNFEFDDNPSSAYSVYQYLKTRTYSDGTGKQIKFTAGCAVNSRGSYNNGDLWENYQGNLTKQQAAEMVKEGWTLENHGYYHSVLNPADNYGYGKSIAENISDNTKYVFEKTGYKMRTLVVPSNDQGYLSPAFDQGIIATSSTNSFEGFQSYPLYGEYVDISLLPANKIHLRRDFNDRWDTDGINSIKAKLTTLFSKSTEKERILYRLGTHMPNVESFKTLADHIITASKDQCWVTTTQEMVEYLLMKNTIIKKETFSDGKLLITLDISNVDKDTHFKDITLMISTDKEIKNISVHNSRFNSFNTLTGLINIGF